MTETPPRCLRCEEAWLASEKQRESSLKFARESEELKNRHAREFRRENRGARYYLGIAEKGVPPRPA